MKHIKQTGRPATALRFVEFGDGCLVALNMRVNQDGYFRKRWPDAAEMFHRFIWRARKGPIPDGYEINHLCGNRACQNVAHLECIDGTEHAIKTNSERYAHEKVEAKKVWEGTGCTPTHLKTIYGARAYGWVREWKRERAQ